MITNFNTFYAAYYRKSFLFVKSYVHNDLAAEDIASEGLIKLWEKIQKDEIQGNPAPFLFLILKNKALDYLKHEAVKMEAYNSMETVYQREMTIRINTLQASNPEEIFSKEIQSITQSVLVQLPERTRKVFEYSRIESRSRDDIAKQLNISQKGVEYHISKALKAFRIALQDYLLLFF